ncbi:MAG: HAMP domain-containing histidine kinase, partial [Acidobacteria bacterium]|nr:HAMP domain-containing histidine kinase [Acidobacteriota bacterium]
MSRAKSNVAVAGFLLVLLPILAVLQYRWIGEVSAAERERLHSSLRVASERLAGDFAAEAGRLSNALQIRGGFPQDASPLIERYSAWAEASSYPHVVRAVYLLKAHPDRPPDQYKVDFQSGELQPVPLQADVLSTLRDRPRTGPGGPLIPWTPGTLTLISPIFGQGRNFEPRDERRGGPDRPRGGPPPGPLEGIAVIELDRNVILKELVPALVQRHFSAHDQTSYRIALVNTADQPQVLYSSEGEWTAEDIATPDASVNIFAPPGNGDRGRGGRGRGPSPFLTPMRGGPGPQGSFQGQRWVLLVKHRLGSLENAVEQKRERDLAVSFGILLILGAGVVSVFISSQRARTLGRLQMEFAAGVSHELRTPLAVIRSAAHNLRTGVVQDKEGVEQYATIVQDEARRLSEMVEEVLLYSETQSGRRKYDLASVDVGDVIDRALANLSPSIDLAKCDLTTHIDENLPLVKGDAAALSQCLQNLLSNAFKYGKTGDTPRIRIEARKDANAREVRLSVLDAGPGIDPADRRQLFEPFYRG